VPRGVAPYSSEIFPENTETVHLNFLKFFSIAGSFRYVDREKVKNFFPLKSRISRILVLSYSKIPQK
jgi:hypothetical protein